MADPNLNPLIPDAEQLAKDKVLSSGGELGSLMRSMNWSNTPLGPVSLWPQSLRTAVSICLHSRFELFIWWGPELVMLYNDAYRQTLRGKHPWALGKPGRVVWAEIWDVIGPMLENVMETGQATWSDDLLLFLERHGYPEETYHTFSYSPILDESGGIGGVFTAVTQTTDKVIGERRLRTLRDLAARTTDAKSESEAWSAVAEVLRENPYDVQFAGLYQLDAEGVEADAVAFAGIEPGHRFFPQRIAIEDSDHICKQNVTETVRTSKPVEIRDAHELGFDLPGGAWKEQPNEIVFFPLMQSGQARPLGVLVAGVNRRKRLDENYRGFFNILAGQISKSIADAQAFEKERKRAEALAEIDRAKTAFFSNVSHEFRTPLTLMLGPLEDTIAEGKQQLGQDNAERLETVHRNGMRLLKLVNTLLDFSRIEAGRVQASYEAVDLSALTRELASVFRSAIERAGMYLQVDCDSISEPIYVDRDMWEKIVLNLLSNAYKFTFTGGIRVELKDAGSDVRLVVSDTGAGIPEKELPRLFERFHRVEGTKGRSFEGSGIGLALVQELVKFHSGKVSVESKLGDGTTFTITIPKGKAHLPADRIGASRAQSTGLRADTYVEEALRWLPAEAEDPAAGLRVAADGRPTVVLADDNADMREYVTKLLSTTYRVLVARNGLEALGLVRNDRVDLVLSDVMMPLLDGFGLLREIRSNAKLASLPVIMLSARAGEEARVEGLEAGADDYLVKPFTARELLARVNAHITISGVRREVAEKENRLRTAAEAERRKLRDLFEQAPAAIAMLSGPQHVWTFLNPRFLRLIARNKGDDWLNKTVRETLPEVESQGFLDLLDRVYKTGERYIGLDAKVNLLDHNGKLRDVYLDFVYEPMRNSEGVVEGILVHCVDVTDKVLARQELEQKQEQLQAALAASETGTFRWDPATRKFEAFDDNLKMLFGIPQTETVTEPEQFIECVHPDDRPAVMDAVERSREGADFDMEFRVSLPGGRVRWLYDRAKLQETDGGHGRFVGACTDITSARELTDQLRTLNDIGQRVAAELDQDKVLQMITDVATQGTGARFGAFFYNVDDGKGGSYMLYTLSGVDRSHFSQFPMPRNTAVFAPTFEGAGPVRSDDIREDPRFGKSAPYHGTPPGHLPVHSYLAVSVKGKEGHVIGGLFFGHEVKGVFTERDERFAEAIAAQAGIALENARLYQTAQQELQQRRKVETELEQQRSFLQMAQKSANVGSWQFDLADGGKITWSEELELLYGYKPGTFGGKYEEWISSVHPEEVELVSRSIAEAVKNHSQWTAEFRIIRLDGAVRWIAGRGQCYYDNDGNPVRMIGVNIDITEKKMAEDALRNSEKLAATGRLAATIAHEINNPLEAVTNCIYLAQRSPDLPESAMRHLELADRELERVSHIAQQTLGFYRDTSAPVKVKISESLRDVLRLFERKLTYKLLSTTLEVSEDLEIEALRGEVRQIFSNLIGNAMDASSKGGAIRLRARSVLRDGSEYVLVSIADRGHGIPQEFRRNIFAPFFTTKKDVGTGLGLWVTKSMVEKHSGKIYYRSKVGQGTVFSVLFPKRMSHQDYKQHMTA